MAYQKTVWVDQNVEKPRTYIVRDNGDNTVTLLDAFGTVREIGTPVNAANMNHIENGIKEIDDTAVHKTGDETIGGTKTFIKGKAGIRISRGSEAYTEVMTTKGDANYTRTGGFRNIEENGINESLMYVATADGSDISEKISVCRNTTTGDVYTIAPVPTDTTTLNSKKIATTGWVNSTGNNVVHRTDNETIAGTKTFSNTIAGSINGNAATVTNGVYTTGNQTIGGTKTFSAAAYGKASDAVNSILTTVSINKSANGKLKLGNGFMIQWFTQNLSSSVSFPVPFDNGCVFVAVVDGQANTMGVSNITKTGFEYRQSYDLPRACRVFAIGY